MLLFDGIVFNVYNVLQTIVDQTVDTVFVYYLTAYCEGRVKEIFFDCFEWNNEGIVLNVLHAIEDQMSDTVFVN